MHICYAPRHARSRGALSVSGSSISSLAHSAKTLVNKATSRGPAGRPRILKAAAFGFTPGTGDERGGGFLHLLDRSTRARTLEDSQRAVPYTDRRRGVSSTASDASTVRPVPSTLFTIAPRLLPPVPAGYQACVEGHPVVTEPRSPALARLDKVWSGRYHLWAPGNGVSNVPCPGFSRCERLPDEYLGEPVVAALIPLPSDAAGQPCGPSTSRASSKGRCRTTGPRRRSRTGTSGGVSSNSKMDAAPAVPSLRTSSTTTTAAAGFAVCCALPATEWRATTSGACGCACTPRRTASRTTGAPLPRCLSGG